MTSLTPPQARIGIVGAGPGGLVCARILQRRGFNVTVFDRDAGPEARNQGGSLDLHAGDGQLALREAGLLDRFWELARPEGQQMRRWNIRGETIAETVPDATDTYKPEIDRGQLRGMLLESLEPGTVRWGRKLIGLTGTDAGARTLLFADGTSVDADLVIGADGAFSAVRSAVSDARPEYSGITFLEAWFDDVSTRHPEISSLVGGGSATASDGTRALYAQRNGGDHIRVYIVLRRALDWVREAGWSAASTDEIRAHLVEEFTEWGPGLQRMVTDNDGVYVDRPLWVLPAPHVWDHSSSVTLLGDAAHLMPPIGVGVNLAMLDGAELALALADASTIDEALVAYEAKMLPRANDLADALVGKADFLLDADDETGVDDKARELEERLEVERRGRASATAGSPHGGVDGEWRLAFATGGGEHAELLRLATDAADGSLSGTYAGDEITHGEVAGTSVRFTVVVAEPMRMELSCDGRVVGDTITGTAESMLVTLPFTAVRVSS